MISTASDLGRLKWAIALLIILCATGGGAVWTTLQWQKAGEKAGKESTAARNDIRSRLARARDEQAELRDKIGRFKTLQERGFIGPEQRLDWVEAMARIKVARRIHRLEYDFAPQRPADASILPGGAGAGGFEFMSSQMRLNAQFLHEGELLGLIDEIRASVRALIQLRSCTLERIPVSPSDRGNPAQLKAECTLEWITLRERK
ncbi:MAG: hypothetical protein HZB40_19595 [Rhodocyclales bacterium]|nr:hypothetical protein [Rhodocyclales bacterium]